jgi:PAS domain S-box-containing protein
LNEANFISFIEQAPIAAAMLDRDMRYVAVSPRWLKERGLDASILGQSVYDIFPDVAAIFRSRHQQALAGETISPFEVQFDPPHGSVEWIRTEMRPWVNQAGRICGIVIFAEDITATKKAEEAQHRSEAELRQKNDELEALYQNAPIGLCYLDRDLRYIRINNRLAEMNGLPVEVHIGRRVGEVLPQLAEEAARIAGEVVSTNKPVRDIEFVGQTMAHSETTRYWNQAWYPVFSQSGDLNGFGVVVEEITERRKARTEGQ